MPLFGMIFDEIFIVLVGNRWTFRYMIVLLDLGKPFRSLGNMLELKISMFVCRTSKGVTASKSC